MLSLCATTMSLFGSLSSQVLRYGFMCKWLIWRWSLGNISRWVRRREGEGVETNEWYIAYWCQLWAAGAQSHKGTQRTTEKTPRSYLRGEGRRLGNSCTPSVCAIGRMLPPRALILQHSGCILHKCRVGIQCFQQDLKACSGGSLVGRDKWWVDTRRASTRLLKTLSPHWLMWALTFKTGWRQKTLNFWLLSKNKMTLTSGSAFLHGNHWLGWSSAWCFRWR